MNDVAWVYHVEKLLYHLNKLLVFIVRLSLDLLVLAYQVSAAIHVKSCVTDLHHRYEGRSRLTLYDLILLAGLCAVT